VPRTAAVFFDVDFTLIHPGPRFQGVGYRDSCARYGIPVEIERFQEAVAGASGLLNSEDHLYDDAVFVRYTQRIIELMGGCGPEVETVAKEIYEDWAEHRHFELYDDVPDSLRALQAAGIRLGLISNSHRPLRSFESHFGLDGLIAVKISSYDHGFMKPHRSIFEAALRQMGVTAPEAVMVGDSLSHDVSGAVQVGMRGILLARHGAPEYPTNGVPVIRSLTELPGILAVR
jgi:HAD superfamily hydrolase (TIGR01662 family)